MMGIKYRNSREVSQPSVPEIHPIWRGIGLIMFVLAPIMGYFGALHLLAENARLRLVPVPADLLVAGRDPLLLVKLILTIAIMFLLISIFQLITFLLYRFFGPARYGPLDVPPVPFRLRR